MSTLVLSLSKLLNLFIRHPRASRGGDLKIALLSGGLFLALSLLASTAPAQSTGSVTLAWNSSPSSDVVGYNLYYGPASGQYTNKVNVNNKTTNTISGLIQGATYYFVVSAYTLAGVESDPSGEIAYTLPAAIVNEPPFISAISNQTILANAACGPLAFTVGDKETPAANLLVSASSSNPVLLPNANIQLGGSGSNRWVTLTPAASQTGLVTVRLQVSDGATNASSSFTLSVEKPGSPKTKVRPNSTGGMEITWESSAGAVYQVYYKTNLIDQNWIAVGPEIVAEDTGASWTDASAGEASLRFYTVRRVR